MSNIWAGKHISRENKLNFRYLYDWWNLLLRFCSPLLCAMKLFFGFLFVRLSIVWGFKVFSASTRSSLLRGFIYIDIEFSSQFRKCFLFVCHTSMNLHRVYTARLLKGRPLKDFRWSTLCCVNSRLNFTTFDGKSINLFSFPRETHREQIFLIIFSLFINPRSTELEVSVHGKLFSTPTNIIK